MILPKQIVSAIEAHARFDFPLEACGLIASDGNGAVRMAYPLTNAAGSASRFVVDPDEHWGALHHAERRGWGITGSFHSHPTSAPVPSHADIDGALDPRWIHLIVGPVDPGPLAVRAYRIVNRTVTAIPLEVGS